MRFMHLLDIFVGLTRGLTPEEVSEPINLLSVELRGMAEDLETREGNLDYSNREKETLIESLKAKLREAEHGVKVARRDAALPIGDGSDSIASQVLRKFIDIKIIDPRNEYIREAITDFYRVTGKKIQTIKHLREMTGMGLKEAKDQVEEWAGEYSPV